MEKVTESTKKVKVRFINNALDNTNSSFFSISWFF